MSSEQIESAIELIFADKRTSKDLDEIHDRFFPAAGAMDGAQYDLIQDRKKFVRAVVKSYNRRVSKEICGYYSVFPLSMQTFEALKSGAIAESQITNDMVLDPTDAGAEVIYVCEICAVDSDAAYHLIFDLKKYVKRIERFSTVLNRWGIPLCREF